MSEIQAKEEKSLVSAVMNETDLRSLVYVIRGQPGHGWTVIWRLCIRWEQKCSIRR